MDEKKPQLSKKVLTIAKSDKKKAEVDQEFLNKVNQQSENEIHVDDKKDDEQKKRVRFLLTDLEEKGDLGAGVSGEVKKVIHKETGIPFALKVIPLKLDQKMKQLIEQEVRTLHNCKHENIIKCYASFYQENAIKILLEFMDRGTLSGLLEKVKKIPENILGMVSVQILKALNFLHNAKIVHRDIKPSNILLNSKGIVKIADFGVCSQIKSSQDSRTTLIGTYKYMSPERIKNENYALSSDIWSFGLTIYECATGIFPYEIEKKEQQQQTQDSNLMIWDLIYMLDKTPSPKLDEKEFSKEFVDFINLCMVKDPKARPTPSQLLNHPFTLLYENSSPKDLAKYLADF